MNRPQTDPSTTENILSYRSSENIRDAVNPPSRKFESLDQVTTFLQGDGIQLVTNSAQLLIAAVIMFGYSPQLALPVMVLAGLLLTGMLGMQRVIARRYDRARRDLARLQTVVAESVAGAPLIQSTGTERRSRDKLDAAVDHARDSLVRTLVPLHGNTSLGELTISTMTVTVLAGGVWWALAGDPAQPRLSAGQVVAMVFLVTFSYGRCSSWCRAWARPRTR